MADKLKMKPCPLCGGAVHFDCGPTYFRKHILYCDGCDMYFALDAVHATAQDLVNAFNRRRKWWQIWKK